MSRLARTLLLAAVAPSFSGCGAEITSGEYGYLAIGQSQSEVLSVLEVRGIRPWPIPYEEKRLVDPDFDQLTALFADEGGIIVWVNGDPFPLRIEFSGNLVSRTWPDERLPTAATELSEQILYGMTRSLVFRNISDFADEHMVEVGNFVVGVQEFRFMNRQELDSNDGEFHTLLLGNDGWEFYGMKEQVWYSAFLEPPYSDVMIYFREGKVERIVHEHFPIELP